MNGNAPTETMKPIFFVGDSRRVIQGFPPPARGEIGYALDRAQRGKTHPSAKPLKGIIPTVLEIVSDERGDTFRAVYTIKLGNAVYVLHAFQKKSKRGVATPRTEIELIKRRLKWAMQLSAQREK